MFFSMFASGSELKSIQAGIVREVSFSGLDMLCPRAPIRHLVIVSLPLPHQNMPQSLPEIFPLSRAHSYI